MFADLFKEQDRVTSRRRRPSRRQRHDRLGLAWYTPEQWSRLRDLSTDKARLEDTYEEWRSFAEKAEADLLAEGVQVQRVPVDVDALATWCTQNRHPIDGEARAEFVAHLMRERAGNS